MKQEAEEHAGEDAKKKEMIEARNQAEQMVYTAEKSVKEHEKEIPEDTKKEIEEKIAEVKTAMGKEDRDALNTATEALTTSLSKIGEIMQKAAEAAADNTGDKQEEATTEDDAPVRDADVTEDKKSEDEK
jgi:molecular chaperone DnaK